MQPTTAEWSQIQRQAGNGREGQSSTEYSGDRKEGVDGKLNRVLRD